MNTNHLLLTSSVLAISLLGSQTVSAGPWSGAPDVGGMMEAHQAQTPTSSESFGPESGRQSFDLTQHEGRRRRTVEQAQADEWDRGELELPTTHRHRENLANMTNVREDDPNALAELAQADASHHEDTSPHHSRDRAEHHEEPRRRTIEQEQADAWDRGEVWQPPVYNPEGESSFMKGVREDKANALAELNESEQERHDSVLPDGLWDQIHSDPIGHAERRIMRRNWMIAIYEDAYLHAAGIGMTNLSAHAYAQIKLDEWRDKSLEDFEQTFGTHFAQLGQAISGDPLGNLQKFVAQGVPITVVRTASTAAKTASNELGTGTTVGKTVTNSPPPVQGENASILLANDHLAARCTNAEATPGWYNVFIHGNGEGFGLKVSGKTVRIGVKTVKDAMIRTGYKGGPVILNSCRTGSVAEGAAQQLADELGETVLAPTTKIAVKKAGNVVTKDGGVWKIFFPTLSATR